MENTNEHFNLFARQVANELKKHGYSGLETEAIKKIQDGLVTSLTDLEEQFKHVLIRTAGRKGYEAFIHHITVERGNILLARPYFRCKKDPFHEEISPALAARNWRGLLKFRINWQFIKVIVQALPLPPKSKLRLIAAEIMDIRRKLVVSVYALAISESQKFWRKTQKTHLSFMDLIQCAVEGFMSGIDKFEPPYTDVFNSVLIQRANGNHIEAYSQTMLHFFPTDKRKIYRANKFLSQHAKGEFEPEALVDTVNVDVLEEKKQTNPVEIDELISAASIVSSDTRTPGEVNIPNDVAKYEAPDHSRPDLRVEQHDLLVKLKGALQKLPVIDQKLIRMRGVDLSRVY